MIHSAINYITPQQKEDSVVHSFVIDFFVVL